MKLKNIKQVVMFEESPHDIYEMLMDEKKHAKFSGSPAKISRKVGGKFTAYDDYIEGENLKLVEDKKIVQKWRGTDWPEGHYSEVEYSLEKVKDGTKLTFKQTGVPADQYDSILKGWIDFYWDPMGGQMKK